MICLRTIALLFLTGAALFGQFLTGLSQNVSRTIVMTPDEAVFNVSVSTTSETTLDILLGILKKVEITTKDLVGERVSSSNGPAELHNDYEFKLTVAPGLMRELAKSMHALQMELPDGVTAFNFTGYLSASAKAAEEARTRALPDMLADARRRADVLARLSGFSLGAIESISDSFYGGLNYGVAGSSSFVYSFNLTVVFGRK